MKTKTVISAAALLLISPLAHAELVNDFSCYLKDGRSVPQLYAFQKEWMAAAHKKGFDATSYKTRIYFPMYAEAIDTTPMHFLWRGEFTNGAVWGRMADWFPTSEWADRFNEIMNCSKGSLWIAPQ